MTVSDVGRLSQLRRLVTTFLSVGTFEDVVVEASFLGTLAAVDDLEHVFYLGRLLNR